MTPSSQVKRLALEEGFDTVGICKAEPQREAHSFVTEWVSNQHHAGMDYMQRNLPLLADPSAVLAGCKSIVCVTLNYNQPRTEVAGEPKIAKYALEKDYHKVLRRKLVRVAKEMAQLYPETSWRAAVDSAPLMERTYAHLAGLGWFGKNTMLIDSKRGSWFFIGVLLTTMELQADKPALGQCGTCTKCIDACPTGAIVFANDRWQVDARKCISYLTIEHRGEFSDEQRQMIDDWTFGCDICQDVCPFNQPQPHLPLRAQPTTCEELLHKRDWPSLVNLANTEHGQWDEVTAGSAVRRAHYEGLKRNARANLENAKAP